MVMRRLSFRLLYGRLRVSLLIRY